MAAVLAGEAAVRIVPTLRNFHSDVRKGLRSQPHELVVKVKADTKPADVEMDAWRARQSANGVKVPIKADFQSFQRDLSQVEHIFKRSSVSKAIRINLVVLGLDALPALAYAAGSAASGLDALAKSSLALPGILGGALSAAGALAVGIHGVKDALQAYSQDSDKATENARKQQDADRELVSAKRNLQSAIRDQKREMEDLNAEMRRSSLSEADAILSIQEDMDRLRQGGFRSITEYQRAQLQLLQDTDHLSEVRRKNNRTIEDANKANAEGVQGSDRVSDALDRVAKATESLDESKITKVSEALGKLSPNAQATVKTLHDLTDEWKKLVQAPVQDKLFEGVDQSLKELGGKTLPVLGAGLTGVASGLNSNLKAIASSLGSDKNTSLLTRIFGNTQGGLQNASKGVDSLIHSILQLTSSSSSFLPRLGDAAEKVFAKFDAWTSKISADGSLNHWIDNGLKAVDSLGRTVGSVGSIISSVSRAFDAASGHSGGFITSLDHAASKLADFLKSTNGQNDLVKYFKQAKDFTDNLAGAFKDAKPFIHDLIQAARDWSQTLFPIIGSLASIASWVERNTGLVKPLLEAYLSFRTVKPVIEGLTGAWKTYSTIMDAVARQGGTGGVVSGGFVNAKNKMADLGQEAGTAADKVGGAGKVSLGSALKGLGSYIGPGLAFSGAIIGVTTLIEQLGEAHAHAATQAANQAAALQGLNNTLNATTGAATSQTLASTAKSFENFTIPGIGNVNVNQLAQQAGVGPEDFVRASSDPSAQGLRDSIRAKIEPQLADKLAGSDMYRSHKDKFDEAKLSPLDIVRAAEGDPEKLAAYRKLMAQNPNIGPNLLGGGAGIAALGQLSGVPGLDRVGSVGRLPTLTDVLGQLGPLGSLGFALQTTSSSIGAESRANAGAAESAFGKFTLSPTGSAHFGAFKPDPSVRLEGSSKRPIVRLNSQPSQEQIGQWSQDGISVVDYTADGVEISLPVDSPDIQRMATGGLVKGVGGPTDDMNLVAMSTGEHVAKAKAVDYYGPKLFDDLNNMRIPKHDTGGWQIGASATIKPTAAPALKWAQPTPGPSSSLHLPGPAFTPSLIPGISGRPPSTLPDAIGIQPAHTPSPGNLNPIAGIGSWFLRNSQHRDASLSLNPNLGLNSDFDRAHPPPPPPTKNNVGSGTVGALTGAKGILASPPLHAATPGTPPVDPNNPWAVALDKLHRERPDSARIMDNYSRARVGLPPLPLDGSTPPSGTPPQGKGGYWYFGKWVAGADGRPPEGQLAPGGSLAPPSVANVPHTQAPVTGGGAVPLGNTPIYSGVPGINGPIIAPSGPVMGQMRGVIDSLVGTPYVWGGFTPAGVDCSGLASIVANIASGRPAFSGRFDTHSELGALTERGFLPGKGGAGMLTIGWNDSHTAITLPDGTAVSSGESGGVQYGGGGSNEGQFSQWMHLPVDAGALDQLGALGIPGLGGPGGIPGGGGPAYLQPKNIMSFLAGQAQNVGSGISSIGLGLLQGATGLNLGPLLGDAQSLGNGAIGALGQQGGEGGGTELNAIAGEDMSRFLTGGLPVGSSGGGGAERWRPMVRQILQQVGPKYGITNFKAWEDAMVKQIGTESSGDPNSQSTAGDVGLFNFKPGTFSANNIMGGSITDPASQIAAVIPYVKNKYGLNEDGSPKGIGLGHGFKAGGFPDGSALVSPGEFITNKNAISYYGPSLYNALNSMSMPKKFMGGFSKGGFAGRFDDGGFPDPLAPPPPPASISPGAIPNPVPPPKQTPGPLSLGQSVEAPASTGGPPGPGATAPAPDPGALPQVADALSGIAAGAGGVGGPGGVPQPGATPSDGQDARATLGAAPQSQDHNLPAVSQGIQGAAGAIGSIAAMAAQMGITAGTMGAGGPAGGAAAQGIQAGAQMAGAIATGAVNILSSLMVGSATPGSTAQASGVPLLPQRQPMQSGVPVIQQRVHNGDIHVTNLDQFKRTNELMDAQNVMPSIGPYGA